MKTLVQPLTLPATGTGSLYFSTMDAPFASLQVVKLAGATTMEFANVSYSNFSECDVAGGYSIGGGYGPLTGSNQSLYWASESGSLPMAFTASSAPASAICQLSGAYGTRHLRVDIGSVTGGTFAVALYGKQTH